MKMRVPAFSSEAEEADWWYKNRRKLDEDFFVAARQGRLRRMNRKKLAARIRAASSRVISIRVPVGDLALARRQAAARGLRYQTYLKSLLHQALRQAKKA